MKRTHSEWTRVEALRKSFGMASDDVPPHAFDTLQYAERFGIPRETARGELATMVRLGALRTSMVRRKIAGGRNRTMRVFWIP